MPPKIAVAMATHDMVPAGFMFDLANLCSYTVAAMPEDASFGTVMVPGTYVHSARQQLIDGLVKDGVTHVLWLDTDMRFPKESFVRLMLHDVPVVGINYAKRKVPTEFVAIKKIGWEPGEASERLITSDESTGLEEVEAIGFGMVLMRMDALRNMPDPREEPWFWFHWVKEKGMQVGEDVQFCRLLRESGVKVYVDHDLSKECAHIGQFEYRCAHAEVESVA